MGGRAPPFEKRGTRKSNSDLILWEVWNLSKVPQIFLKGSTDFSVSAIGRGLLSWLLLGLALEGLAY
jgi:hypothetical protein